ncbi:MAG TPA: acyl-CoA dehydrogenase family protein [Lichenihabitans sp.]|jgi:alkylation response protein AidB-like acyl-CoA dehydrogenase|nr:acyl-CoA dehydrogenase family protein [Lichenihabitans sp.]
MLSADRAKAVMEAAAAASDALFGLAEELDRQGDFPDAAMTVLRRHDLLAAPFRVEHGGAGLTDAAAAADLFAVLRRVGAGDLSTGRLYEGHVNAVALVERFGTPAQARDLAEVVRAGALSAVWNAEGRTGVRLERRGEGWCLVGRKILASGAGHVTRPLVTACQGNDLWMTLPILAAGERADLSGWTAQGMRSSATGLIDLDEVAIRPEDLVGEPGDYKRQPGFSGGGWRFCAVQLGAAERLVDLYREALVGRGRDEDPYQRQRIAECAAATESAALWIGKAARMVAEEARPAADIVAYVGLTRMVTERAALDVLERVHRGMGLMSFIRPNAVERIGRDLATYLRQPAPDGAMADAAGQVLASTRSTRDLWTPA